MNMIKKYIDFVQESFNQEEHHSLGEYIEGLSKDDQYIQMLIGEYTKDIDASISVSNAINVLDDMDKVELLKRVENHLNGVEGELSVGTSTPVNLLEESYGKNILTTFMKCLTALGFKDNTPESKEVPAEFLIFFKFIGVDSSKIESVFKRFKSLSSIQIDYSQPKMVLYFGIKNDGNFEYGYYYDELVPIGQFKLNKSTYNSLKLSDLKATSGLKKELVNLKLEDIILMGKIKLEMDKFNPGYFEQKMIPTINDRIMTFGYYGVGKWDNGQLSENDLMSVKDNLKLFLSKYKWSEKIQISLVPSKFWIYVNIKLK
jgi:hypothetical protein